MPFDLSCILSTELDPATEIEQLGAGGLEAAASAGCKALMCRVMEPEADLAQQQVRALSDACKKAHLALVLDVAVVRFPIDHALVTTYPGLFALRRNADVSVLVDPRHPLPETGEAIARLRDSAALDAILPAITQSLFALIDAGAEGFCFRGADQIAPAFLTRMIAQLRGRRAGLMTLVDASGLNFADVQAYPAGTIDGFVYSYVIGRQDPAHLMQQREYVRPFAPLIAAPRASQLAPDNPEWALAAASSDGVVIPLGAWHDRLKLADTISGVRQKLAPYGGEMRRLTAPGQNTVALLRADAVDVRASTAAALILVNLTDTVQPALAASQLLAVAGADFEQLDDDATSALLAGEVRILATPRARPITSKPRADTAVMASLAPRLVIENISPSVDGGFAVKRVTGETIDVTATIFADGHEQLAAELRWRPVDSSEWTAVPMTEGQNDLWQASFAPTRMGRHEFVIEAWLDRFGGFARDFRKKFDAGVAVAVDYAEGRLLVSQVRDSAKGVLKKELGKFVTRLARDDQADLLLSDELGGAMMRARDRQHLLRSEAQFVDAERLAARFSSWYELFPRSQSSVPGQHGGFDDVIRRLPAIRDMGFDTLYFPPINPIGDANRKGPNNTLTPAPGDPGSPYAIGSVEGGHDAIHPELGSLDDFLRLVEAARTFGMEIALDFAIQCSPDHPWLKQNPGWFAWRSDGSMKYAENPPKKYQDIVNVDFYAKDAAPGLWLALRDVVLTWIERGVKTFRVDNPHTKTLPFWEWMIGDVRMRHPEAIFLAEAFTRPAMMYRLAKVGFSQSYTYFTWRNDKAELTSYITELTTTAPKEFYRPHFFVNTPDINPLFLQTSGRPGFRIRAALAATLSGLFGVYSGFELCEAAPVPGKEEYLDSEKYELRQRDWQAPGNIIADITMLNRVRRAYPALQTHLNTRFYTAHNDSIIYYGKPAPDGSHMILVMVNLDPHTPQEAAFEAPLWEFGLSDTASLAVEDLAEGYRFEWRGKMQWIRLTPDQPYRIWRIAPGESA